MKGRGRLVNSAMRPSSSGTTRESSPSESESTSVGVIISAVNLERGRLKRLRCTVGESEIELLVDSGAVASILNTRTVKALRPTPLIHNSLVDLTSYTGQKIKVVGTITLSVRCGEQHVPSFKFVMVEEGDNLMGIDLLDALGVRITLPGSSCQVLVVRQQSEAVVQRFPKLIKPPATIKGFVHKPAIDDSVRPCLQPYRRVPIALEEPVTAELSRMKREGIIAKIDASPWVSNMVVVRKPDGGVRICCDMSLANQAVIADRFPLPTLEELTTDFAGATYFSKLDLKWGYLQVKLHRDARDLTGMITLRGLYRWTRMPFGLSSAPSAFQKIIAIITKGCKGSKNLLDDIAVWGRTKAEHDARLACVLQRLDKFNLRLNSAKCL